MERRKSLAYAVVCGLLVSGLAGTAAPLCAQEPASPEKNLRVEANSTERGATTQPVDAESLPDSPGASISNSKDTFAQGTKRSQENPPDASLVAQNQPASQPTSPQSQSNSTQSTPNASPDAQKPVGTAAAEGSHATGVAASQPAGVAIAPAKQHRVRTIVIRVGAIVGAGVAVGTVVGLTEATSSKPPGAH
jgi:hypothetical protein